VLAVTRKHHAVLYPLGVYVFTRLLFFFATLTGPQLTTPHGGLKAFVVRWDAVYYLTLVRHGYPHGSGLANEQAFFPLYPLTVRVVDWVLPQGDFTAALSVSLGAGAVASVLLWRIAARFADTAAADRTVLVFCLFPGTIVFAWPYADALLVAFMCGTICLLLDGRWVAASGVAALATATRPSGMALLVACALVAYAEVHGDRARRLRAAVTAAVIAASGFLLFLLYLWIRTGNALQWFDVEREQFGEGTPWKRLPTTISGIFTDGAEYGRVLVVVFAVIAVVLLVAQLRSQQPLWATSITVIALYFALTANIACASPRLQLAAVPAFAALGARLRDQQCVFWCVASVTLAVTLIFVYGLTTNLAP
jgi:hypothetical protein